MNSRIVLSVFFLSFKASLFAQTTIGVEGGFCYNTYYTNIVNRAATVLRSGAGFNVALPFRYPIFPWLYATALPSLVQKGYSMNRTDSLAGEYDQHLNTYIQLPIGVSLVYKWRRLQFDLDPGFYAGYWLYGRTKGQTADIFSAASNNSASGQASEQFGLSSYNQQYSFATDRDNRWEAGWWLGPGVEYRLSNTFWLTAFARYFQSITSQEKTAVNPIPAYNHTWTFSVGVRWMAHKSKPRT